MGIENPSSFAVFIHRYIQGPVVRPLFRKLINSIGLKGSEHVMDFGSGWGEASKIFAGIVCEKGGHLTCVDVSEKWMDVVKKRLSKFKNAAFKVGDIDSLDIEDNSFDLIFINYVIHDIQKDLRHRVIDVLAVKLKKGGRIFINEPTGSGHGMPADDIKELMINSGLKEVSSVNDKIFLIGPMYKGMFERT